MAQRTHAIRAGGNGKKLTGYSQTIHTSVTRSQSNDRILIFQRVRNLTL